ncbi:hypothetical protein [Stenotrophomonas indicatrix]|uniref:Uncharacterized protein n=1 Tax=Stenotrophomonas indicatrix TaxID=2045451 RepID=A0ABT8QEG4_9GAMM|nr:hypothetical protein [Stenotrophomonas indicatrix]MDN8662400.1 hypothetical protein [Stenotrophomonas indicatrix]MDN8670280.1 hypothetical protein [Stenotrophomonas indicatrix]
MKDAIRLTISNQRFTLTKEEAKFIAEHLRTAIAQPNLALNFSHREPGTLTGRITVARGPGVIEAPRNTDC